MAKKKKEKVQQPQYYTSRINTTVLNYNVYIMKPAEKLGYMLLLLICGGLVGQIFYGGLFRKDGVATLATYISNGIVFVVVGLLAIKSFLPVLTESLRKKRIKKLRTQFCDYAAALTNALGSGMNMREALESACSDLQGQYAADAYIVIEAEEIINGVRNNVAIENMLGDFGARSGVQDISDFATVFQTCYRTGGDIKSVIRRTTELISEKTIISSEIETAITSNKLQANAMMVLPLIIIVMMRGMSPEFDRSFSTVIGVIALTISAGLFIGAFKMSQKIMDIRG